MPVKVRLVAETTVQRESVLEFTDKEWSAIGSEDDREVFLQDALAEHVLESVDSYCEVEVYEAAA